MEKFIFQRFEGRKQIYIRESNKAKTNETKAGLHTTGATGADGGPLYYCYAIAEDFEAAKNLIAVEYPKYKVIIQS